VVIGASDCAAATGAGPLAPDLADIPAGMFTMGSDDPYAAASDGASPAHDVEVPAFRIGRAAVTNDEFAAIVAATGYLTTAEQLGWSFAPNGFALHEVTGDVWEWCADWFAADTYRRPRGAVATGPTSGTARVMRGGSCLCHESYCWRYRVDSRSASSPDSSTGNVGFRVAMESAVARP
jgi:formylglycine-generating enzyme required for sulfatase activity